MKKGFIVTGIAILAMVMLTAYASADGGWGWGRHHMGGGYHKGGGYHMWGGGYGDGEGGRYGSGPRAWANLSEEDARKLDKERETFFNDTAELRQSLHQKRLEMRAEMTKKDPDVARLTDLQKDVSGLKAQLDQKRLAHRLEMKKLVPESEYGNGRGGGRGYGRGPGYGGECWRQ